jgi:hypothetical protein
MIAQADKISDPKMRASFLTIEGNREIARVYGNMVERISSSCLVFL